MKVLIGLLACVFVTALFLTTFEGSIAVLVGWIPFLARVIPRMSVEWSSATVGLVAIFLFAVGVHGMGYAWRKPRSEEAVGAPRWRLRWTISIVTIVLILFAAGISIIGIVHQTSWLSRSERYGPTLGGGWLAANNMKEINYGMQNYQGVYNGRLPKGGTFSADGTMLHSWETEILVYMNYGFEVDMKKPWNHPGNQQVFKSIIPQFINPGFRTADLEDGDGYGLSHYSVNSHVLAGNKSMKLQDIKDGAANTLLVGEVNAQFKPWGHPVNWRDPTAGINSSPRGFGGPPHSGGATFAMADGSIRFVSEKVSPDVLRALSTPNGGEAVGADGWHD